MSITFFSATIPSKYSKLKLPAAIGAGLGLTSALAYNEYRNSTVPYTSSEISKVDRYNNAASAYPLKTRLKDELYPSAEGYSTEGEEFLEAEKGFNQTLEDRKRRMRLASPGTSLAIGAAAGTLYGVSRLSKSRVPSGNVIPFKSPRR